MEFGEKTQNKSYYGVQGHRGQYQSKACMRLLISDLIVTS